MNLTKNPEDQLRKIVTLYKNSTNKSLSSNRNFIHILCENHCKLFSTYSQSDESIIQKGLTIIMSISQEYLINYREILKQVHNIK